MRISAVFATLFIFIASTVQAEIVMAQPRITLVKEAGSVNAFIPKGWEMEAKSEGDLNHDGKSDVAFILRKVDSSKIKDEHNANPRILAVAFGNEGNKYKLFLQHDTFIPADDNPDIEDPFGGITIRNGVLKITFHYWSSVGSWGTGDTTFTFRYQENCFKKIGSDSNFLHRATLDQTSTSINFLTGKMIKTSQNEETGKKGKTTSSYVGKKSLKCINEIINGTEDYE